MPKYCANLTMLFQDLLLVDRIAAASHVGFDAVEILFPYDDNVTELREALDRHEMPMALINGPLPNYTGGERGWAAVPHLQDRFRRDLRRVVRYANSLRAERVHLMTGVAEGPEARATFVENLKFATSEHPKQNFTIEPINNTDMPGYFLNCFDMATDILDEVAAPNLGLQFDAYHAHIITGDVMGTWDKVKSRVVHIQVAGYPGRHEPEGGEIDFPGFLRVLDDGDYHGWVSGEYTPRTTTEAGLAWMREW